MSCLGILNPFAVTIGKSSPAANPFALKAQVEERNRRVPLNQLQPSTQNSYVGGIAPGPTIPPSNWPALAVVYTPQQSMVQASQGYNPFL